ncbi:MAG: hypothetical protein JSW51_07720 [Gemmatimonadota bacterium]|nr:MAG: hypothetical protein JSW51_07720 [Gemmatimonadota bacterium]
MAFHLCKWYFDCVTETGDAALLYWASIRWGLLRFRYGATLVSLGADPTEQRDTLRPRAIPEHRTDGTVGWKCQRLGVDAEWAGDADDIERTLLEDERGSIRWHCLLPRADATVRVGSRTLSGLGYVECLTMSVRPWQLPIEELRWGRFTSHSDSLVWIDWRGALRCTWAFANGVELRGAAVGSSGLNSSDDEIVVTIDDGRTVRSGPLSSSALHSVKWLLLLMPRWRHAAETKWVARARLTDPKGSRTGWAVHEVVQWL